MNDANVSALLQKESQEFDDGKRLQLVHQAQQMEADLEYYPMLISSNSTVFTQPWVQGLLYSANLASGTESVAYVSLNR